MKITFDSVTRVSVLTDDGVKYLWTKEMEVLGAVPTAELEKAATAKQKQAEKEAKAKEKKAASRNKTYPVPEFAGPDLNAMLRGDWDSVDRCATREHRQKVLEAACDIQRRTFKLDSITYTVHDAQICTSLLSAGVKPSAIAKAIRCASKDEFWIKTGCISWDAIQRHWAKLSSRYSTATSGSLARLKSLIERLREVDPMMAKSIEEDLSRMSESQATEMVRQVESRIEVG